MAVAYQTHTTSASATVQSGFTLTKPSGLAVGDLMVMIVTFNINKDLVLLSGWTDRVTNFANNASIKTNVQYKTATAGDVAASNFTWDFFGADTSAYNAILMRISGAADITITDAYGDRIDNDATPTFSFNVPITPTYANSLLLAAVAANDPSTTGVSAYSISVSNPTWTERADSATGYRMGVATAVRPQTTAVGTLSATFDNGSSSTDSIAYVMCIAPIVNETGTLETADITPSVKTVSATGGTLATIPTVVLAPLMYAASSFVRQQLLVTNTPKNSVTITNEPKSNIS